MKLLSDHDITSVSPSCIDNGVVKFNNILKTAATLAGPPAVRHMRKPKFVVWSPEIRCFLLEKKQAFNEWKRGGKPNDPSHPLLIAKREKRQALRRVCRIQMAAKHNEERQEILNAKSENTLLFQKLIRKQRGNLAGCVDELHVSGEVYKGDGVLSGWYEHFKTLSSSSERQSFNQDYHHLVLMDTNEIEDICHAQGQLSAQVTKEEVKKAIKELDKG